MKDEDIDQRYAAYHVAGHPFETRRCAVPGEAGFTNDQLAEWFEVNRDGIPSKPWSWNPRTS
jgi:hypothetical protein